MLAIRDSAGNSVGETVLATNKNNQTNLDFDKPHRIKVLRGNWDHSALPHLPRLNHRKPPASLTNRIAWLRPTVSEVPPTRAMLAFRSLGDNSLHLDLISRYEHCFDRQHYRALAALNNEKDRKTATRSQFFEDNKGQPKGDGPFSPPVEPKI